MKSALPDFAARFPPADEAALAAVDERAITYPLGSGQGEEIALRAGMRPMIRQLLEQDDLARTRAQFERLGFVTGISTATYGPTRDGFAVQPESIDAARRRVPLFIGRDRGAIDEAIAAEDVFPKTSLRDAARLDDVHRTLGRLLGYPRCCVEAFVAVAPPRRNDALLIATTRSTRGSFVPRLNVLDLGVFHWISWMPCSFECPWSTRYADALFDLVASRHPAFAHAIDRALGMHRLVLHPDVQLSIEGTVRGKIGATETKVEKIEPTSRHRHPSASLPPDVRDATARALSFIRNQKTIGITPTGLRVEGAPLELPVAPLLVPFGVGGNSPA